MLRIAICDDEAPERLRLREWLTDYCAAKNLSCIFTEYSCGETLCADYDDGSARFDLIFLDIYMGGMNGVGTACIVRRYDRLVTIVFLTTSPDHAIEGYTVNAGGYLLKPATDEQLTALMERLSPVLRQKEESTLLVGGPTYGYRLTLTDISWVESRGKGAQLHMVDGTIHTISQRLTEVEAALTAPYFLKCNRGVIVNMEHVTDARENFTMGDGTCVPIKVRDRKHIREQYFAYMMKRLGTKP